MPRHIIPISGKDSLATAIVQTEREPENNYEFMFNPTGEELPDVFNWIKEVERYLGKPIVHVGESLGDIIEYDMNWFLPSHNKRYCTRMSKIEPMEKFIGKDDAYVYYGIRADENRVGYNNNRYKNIIPVYPLVEAGINMQKVYEIINSKGLKPPTFFWERLYVDVCNSLGGNGFLELLSEWEYDFLFSWRSRANCAMCHYQRKYEWLGLYEHYPELFSKYEKWEHNVSEFYFNGEKYPLTKIIDRKNIIFNKRAKEVKKYIRMKQQMLMKFKESDLSIDLLQTTSCGLFCSK